MSVRDIGSVIGVRPVVKSNTTVIPMTRALWIGSEGDVTARFEDGEVGTLKNVPAGILPVRVSQVMAATTAGEIVALY